jgi:hypothetical protein
MSNIEVTATAPEAPRRRQPPLLFTSSLDIPCWILDIRRSLSLFDIGYSPFLRVYCRSSGLMGHWIVES